MSFCPACGTGMTFVAERGAWWCPTCQVDRVLPPTPAPVAAPTLEAPAAVAPVSPLWTQDVYRLRKKTLAIANQYWIEDAKGATLGYSRQKMLRLKEDVRIFTDESMTSELFRIQQQQIMDLWGNYAVIDSATNATLGRVRREPVSSAFVRDEWQVYDSWDRLVGEVAEETGRGVARKWLPGGALIPEKMTMTLQGVPIAKFDQQFKVIGDIWNITCLAVPPTFDRRVFLGCALLMSMIERARK